MSNDRCLIYKFFYFKVYLCYVIRKCIDNPFNSIAFSNIY